MPSKKDLFKFDELIRLNSEIDDRIRHFYKGFDKGSHPMSVMIAVVAAMSSFFNDNLNIHNSLNRQVTAVRLIAKIPTIAAMAYRLSVGMPFVRPK